MTAQVIPFPGAAAVSRKKSTKLNLSSMIHGIVNGSLGTDFIKRAFGVTSFSEVLEIARTGSVDSVCGTFTLVPGPRYLGPHIDQDLRAQLCWHFELRPSADDKYSFLLDVTNGRTSI
jgi:hypothetical protein